MALIFGPNPAAGIAGVRIAFLIGIVGFGGGPIPGGGVFALIRAGGGRTGVDFDVACGNLCSACSLVSKVTLLAGLAKLPLESLLV
jgi:hypothetical protein